MKAEIHPEYSLVNVTCSCGNTFATRSTLCHDLTIEVCSQCHPFYTGKQKVLNARGPLEKFLKRYKMHTPVQAEPTGDDAAQA